LSTSTKAIPLDKNASIRTIYLRAVPAFVRELHELVLDEDEHGQFDWTDKACLATFFGDDIAELFPDIQDLKTMAEIQLVYSKSEETIDDYYHDYGC
jgi:hypothetical protein